MYLHRPDLLSLVFGLLFTAVGLWALLTPAPSTPDPIVVAALLAVTAGVGIIGSMVTGDVHRQAGARRARAKAMSRHDAGGPVGHPAPWHDAAVDDPFLDDPFLDDPLFAPPIDPETLDREYRETFGDDDPAGPGRGRPDGSGEGTPDGATG